MRARATVAAARVHADKERIQREEAARAARVREEERKAILTRVTRLPAAERAKALEEEQMLAKGRAIAAKVRKSEGSVSPEWARDVFGIEVE